MNNTKLVCITLLLVGSFNFQVHAVVTSDEIGSHRTTPGKLAFGFDVDGVGLVAARLPHANEIAELIPDCTGTLISDKHVLLAAHCFDSDYDGQIDIEFHLGPEVVAFESPDGPAILDIGTGNEQWHAAVKFPSEWPEIPIDLAVVELSTFAPANVPRYPLYGGNREVGRQALIAGYGNPGIGSVGEDEYYDSEPTKRAGLNRVEAIRKNEGVTYVLYDFDSGLAENNALALYGYESDLGFGADEVNGGQGDSGGPIFVDNVLVGVFSSSLRSPYIDATESLDRSWGELGLGVRVSAYRDFILTATDGMALFVPDGDFDHDGIVTALDIDRLDEQIRSVGYAEQFDFNLDDVVDREDRRIWVEELAGTYFGDADLNQEVDFGDFLALSGGFGEAGGWATGDFDGSGDVQFPDFLLLSSNFGQSADIMTVPEADCFSLILISGIVVLGFVRELVSCQHSYEKHGCLGFSFDGVGIGTSSSFGR